MIAGWIVGWFVADCLVAGLFGAVVRLADRREGAARRAAPNQIPDDELPSTYRP